MNWPWFVEPSKETRSAVKADQDAVADLQSVIHQLIDIADRLTSKQKGG